MTFDQSSITRLRETTQSWVERDFTQAISYIVMQGGEIVLREAFGHIAPDDHSANVTCSSIFRISSVSKVVTAATAMTLVDDGRLSLNRTVSHYLPEFQLAGQKNILVKDLFTHTSGLHASDYDLNLKEILSNLSAARSQITYGTFLEAAITTKPRDTPGTICRYAGVNYVLLGEVIARCAKQGFDVLAKERIFDPLGMNDSKFGFSSTMQSRWVRVDPQIFKNVQPPYDPNDVSELRIPHPSGHLFSTADDMAVFCQMFLDRGYHNGERVLSPAAVDAMTSNQIHGVSAFGPGGRTIANASWGLGWMLQDTYPWKEARRGILTAPGTFHHQGAAGIGVWCDPRNEIVGVYLSTIRAYDAKTDEYEWDFDLFQNMVTAAIA